ncbi:MAG: class I SAM-dependent RNA methyltransferase [Planctomycetes bacterium]|nr:class I SAM-dependent RNA methyltransferase [Planctomycetota bacterium]
MSPGQTPSPHPGRELDLVVESLGDGADALCRSGGLAVFVPGALPGERIRARVTDVRDDHARAELVDVLERSPLRAEPRCRHFGSCAGCRLQHVEPAAASAHKAERLRELLARRFHTDVDLQVRAAPDAYGQRCRIELTAVRHRGRAWFGMPPLGAGGRPLAIEACPASDPAIVAAAFAAADEALRRELEVVRAIVAQRALGPADSDVAVCIVATTGRLPHAQRIVDRAVEAGARQVLLNVHEGRGQRLFGRRDVPLRGAPTQRHRIADGVELVVAPTAFLPDSSFAATGLVAAIRALALPGAARAVDLYCGVGVTSLALATGGCRITGVDWNEAALEAARRSADASGATATFRDGDVEAVLPQLERTRPDIVLLDPPAAGSGPAVAAGVARLLTPEQVLAVGRSTGALLREVAQLAALGYAIERVEALDADPLGRDLLAVASLRRAH